MEYTRNRTFIERLGLVMAVSGLLGGHAVWANDENDNLHEEIARSTEVALAELQESAEMDLAISLHMNHGQFLADARESAGIDKFETDTLTLLADE